MIRELSVSGYRSIRSLDLQLHPIALIVGANGCGKTNLYRSLYLLWTAASGTLARSIADEGGMPSVVWAGGRQKGPVRLSIDVTLDDLRYQLVCGLPIPPESAFALDPVVKEEQVWILDGKKPIELLHRGGGSVWLRDGEGVRITFPFELSSSESVLSQLVEPHRFPVLSRLRQELLAWRFYHQFRSDAESPIRQPQIGVKTPVLGHDGRDLAAALETIFEIGDSRALMQAIDRAFPGARLTVQHQNDARFHVTMTMPGVQRPLDARELSDGTLRYLCLCAALLSPRPPAFLALNEPETSLHPDLFEPLAHLIVHAAKTTQICLTTHSETLTAHVTRLGRVPAVRLEKVNGETRAPRAVDD